MSMVTSDPITLLNDVKPFKTTWKVEVKVLHSWTQHSSYSGGDSLQFILADKRGVKIHCTCKKLFYGRVKKLQVGQWRFIENFLLTASAGKYRATSHKYKMSIISNSIVSNSSLKNDDKFLSLTSFKEIMNGSLDSNFLIDVIGQAIDIGDIQVVPVQGGKETKKLELTLTDTEDQQVACCLWGRFAEQMLYTSKVAQVNQNFLCLLRFAKINVYKGCQIMTLLSLLVVMRLKSALLRARSLQLIQTGLGIILVVLSVISKRFKLHLLIKDDTGETRVLLLDSIAEPILGVSAEVLLDGSLEEIEDPEDLPDVINDLIGKTFKFGVYVSKDNVDYGSDIFNIGKTWSADEIISQSDDENTEDTLTNIALSDRSSGQVSLISIESEDTTCLSSTPLSKRKGNNEIDDFSSTSKKQCSKIIKVEKNGGE
ncbi:BnaA06g33980D [Brassica napus]|uniref:(rape) hypothetical protein n=1 Tax=Brassica napus TaxID=3708 RepID=A0A078I701_BRANA|nr:unnamed protein product [Brassica napus]CDY45194.1 BnaA06g33980D [Brassica napus]